MAWQTAQTKLQVKWSPICNKLHIDGTPHQLFSSLPVSIQEYMLVNMERGEA